MRKKLPVVIAAAMALAAFALPAAAQANNLQWFTDPGNVTLAEPGEEEVHIVGELETWIGAPTPLGIKEGPCPVTFTGKAYNEGGLAKATIETGSSSTSPSSPCPTDLAPPRCEIEEITFNAFPWEVTAIAGTHEVLISNVTITDHYGGGCPAGDAVSAAGSVTGKVTTVLFENEEDCIFFHNAGPLIVENDPNNTPIYLSGEVCVTLPLTLHTA